jgi:hypothetical protein
MCWHHQLSVLTADCCSVLQAGRGQSAPVLAHQDGMICCPAHKLAPEVFVLTVECCCVLQAGQGQSAPEAALHDGSRQHGKFLSASATSYQCSVTRAHHQCAGCAHCLLQCNHCRCDCAQLLLALASVPNPCTPKIPSAAVT